MSKHTVEQIKDWSNSIKGDKVNKDKITVYKNGKSKEEKKEAK